jgi:cytolysin (calcineurin-like family phosphatase)
MILIFGEVNEIIVHKTATKDIILQDMSVTVEAQTTVSQASVESVMRAIRQRLKARIALCRQVQALGKMPCNNHQNSFDIVILV